MSRSRDIAEILGATEAANSDNRSLGAGVGAPGGGLDSDAATGLINSDYIDARIEKSIQFNQEGTLSVTSGTARWYAPKDITINKIEGFLGTAGTGSATTFATLINGTQNRTDSISASSTTSSTTGLSISVTDGQYLTVDITAVGTSSADLSVRFYYT